MQIEMEQRHSNILFLSSIMYVYKKNTKQIYILLCENCLTLS